MSAKGGWGTVDDLYLYQTKSADKSDADNGNTGDDENKKPDTPSTDDNNKDNTGSGDTNKDDSTSRMTIQPMVIRIAIQETVIQPHSLQRLLHREQLYQAHPTLKQL